MVVEDSPLFICLGTTLAEISGSVSALDTGTREIASGTDNLSKRTEEAKDVASRANRSASESAKVRRSAG